MQSEDKELNQIVEVDMCTFENHFDKQFFVITSENWEGTTSRLYGVCYLDDVIVANYEFEENDITIPDSSSGCYIFVNKLTDRNAVEIKQDLCYSLYIYYYINEEYWAVSNSFFKLCETVSEKFSLSMDEEFFECLYSTGASVLTYRRTMAREIKVLPLYQYITIENGEIRFVDDCLNYNRCNDPVFLDSEEGMQLLDEYISKWSSTLLGIHDMGWRIKYDVTGGYDSRVSLALAVCGNVNLDNSRVHLYSNGKINDDGGYAEDYLIASELAKMYGFYISKEYSPKWGVRIPDKNAFDIYKYVLSNCHRQAYCPSEYFEEPVFYVNGLNMELLRGFGKGEKVDDMLGFFNYASIKEGYEPVVAWKESLAEMKSLASTFFSGEANGEELSRLFFQATRSRSHMCSVMYQNYVLNYYQFTNYSDLNIVRMRAPKSYKNAILYGTIFYRVDPKLIDVPISDNRSFTEDEKESIKELCNKYKSGIKIKNKKIKVLCDSSSCCDNSMIYDNKTAEQIIIDRFEDVQGKSLFLNRFLDYGVNLYEHAEKQMNSGERFSNQYISMIGTAMDMLKIEKKSSRYYGNNIIKEDKLMLRKMVNEYDSKRLEMAVRRLDKLDLNHE